MNRLIVVQNIEREGPGLFNLIANQLGLEIINTYPFLGDSITIPKQKDILLILGGSMGLSDLNNPEYSWLKKEIALIKYVMSADIPFIGICLGAQLLAYVAGGNVTPLLGKNSSSILPEIGWSKINFIKENIPPRLNIDLNNDFYALHWHGDRILLPKGNNLLASTDRCREQIFMIGRKNFGIQCHIEVEEEDVERWIIEDEKFIKLTYGEQGKKILRKQNQMYCTNTKEIRSALISNILTFLK